MSRGVSVPDHRVLTALRTAYNNDETDAGGGCHPEHVAQYVPLKPGTLRRRLPRLAEDDRIGRVCGISSDGNVRHSYVPPEEIDDDPDLHPRA